MMPSTLQLDYIQCLRSGRLLGLQGVMCRGSRARNLSPGQKTLPLALECLDRQVPVSGRYPGGRGGARGSYQPSALGLGALV